MKQKTNSLRKQSKRVRCLIGELLVDIIFRWIFSINHVGGCIFDEHSQPTSIKQVINRDTCKYLFCLDPKSKKNNQGSWFWGRTRLLSPYPLRSPAPTPPARYAHPAPSPGRNVRRPARATHGTRRSFSQALQYVPHTHDKTIQTAVG